MADFTVTGTIDIDSVQAEATIAAIQTKIDDTMDEIVRLRARALTTISYAMGIVSRTYSVMSRLVSDAGGIIDPVFDAFMQTISAVTSTAISSAIMLTSTMNPVLVGIGIGLLIVSTALNIKATAELMEGQRDVKRLIDRAQAYTRRPTGVSF